MAEKRIIVSQLLKFRVPVLLKSAVNRTTSPHKEAVFQELEANSILEPAMNVKK